MLYSQSWQYLVIIKHLVFPTVLYMQNSTLYSTVNVYRQSLHPDLTTYPVTCIFVVTLLSLICPTIDECSCPLCHFVQVSRTGTDIQGGKYCSPS